MYTFTLIITGILGAISTFYLNNILKLGAVRSSAGLSLVVGLIFYVFSNIAPAFLTKNIPIVFIGATFIGMVSKEVIAHYFLLALAGALFAIIYVNSSAFFNGYGGALGTTASITVLVAVSLAVVSRNKHIEKIKRKVRRR